MNGAVYEQKQDHLHSHSVRHRRRGSLWRGSGWRHLSLSLYETITMTLSVEPTATFAETISSSNSPTDNKLIISNTDIQTATTQSVQGVGPAVVTVVGTVTYQYGFWGQTYESEVSGSGFFISEDGYILTNNHVVEDTETLKIILSDGSEQDAVIVGTDIFSDIAVLKIDGDVPAVAMLGNSDMIDSGETMIAIGSPLGEFVNTVTVGVVSATGRSIDTGEGYSIEGLIQTDAAINQGNSGGPLINLAGEVVGINTLIVRSSNSGTVAEGLGFAIPSNTAAAIASQIIEKGYFARPYFGVTVQTINPNIAYRYRLPVEYGAYITQVHSDSPASKVDLQEADIITSLGGLTIDEKNSYYNVLFRFSPSDKITVEFVRNGQLKKVEVTMAESTSN